MRRSKHAGSTFRPVVVQAGSHHGAVDASESATCGSEQTPKSPRLLGARRAQAREALPTGALLGDPVRQFEPNGPREGAGETCIGLAGEVLDLLAADRAAQV